MDHFVLDEEGWCYENEWDKIFSSMRLSTNFVKLRMLK
jgi:hypothetical protein